MFERPGAQGYLWGGREVGGGQETQVAAVVWCIELPILDLEQRGCQQGKAIRRALQGHHCPLRWLPSESALNQP